MKKLTRTAASIGGTTGAITLALALTQTGTQAQAQGCVAVRGTSMSVSHPVDSSHPDDAELATGDWVGSLAYRWLHSTRHFVGDAEQTSRQDKANQVINHSNFIDLGLQYAFSPRYSAALTLPFVSSDRSSLAPTNFASIRYYTHSTGIGDARLTGYAWLWDPTKPGLKGNIQLGLGIKVPTGESGVTDTFLTANGPVVHPVDQSIQPGDGGWGFAIELTAYREILAHTEAFLQLSYLFNPQNQNDTLTWRDNNSLTPGKVTSTTSQAAYYEHFMSIPDQYFARGGLAYTVVPKWGLSVSLAGRIEGVPVEDLIGSSDGFRRPGFAVAVEPGIQVMKGRYTFNLAVPFALYRNRERSVADQAAAAVAGKDVHGDAAFADYVVTASLAVRF
jgi:hypothetical protein